MVMSLLGIVTNAMCFMFYFNFYFSMTWLFLTYLLAEGWMSPAVAMIQATIDVRFKGVAMGVVKGVASGVCKGVAKGVRTLTWDLLRAMMAAASLRMRLRRRSGSP